MLRRALQHRRLALLTRCVVGLLNNGGNSVFEIMGQAEVFPAIHPNSARMAVGWLTGQNRFFQQARAARGAKKISVFAGSALGWHFGSTSASWI